MIDIRVAESELDDYPHEWGKKLGMGFIPAESDLDDKDEVDKRLRK